MNCPQKEPVTEGTDGIRLSESAPAPTSVFRFSTRPSKSISGETFGRKPPPLPPFNREKSASHGSIPIFNGKPMRDPPPQLTPPPSLSKGSRRRKLTATLRKSAHVSLVEMAQKFRPQAVMYIIYNVSQAESLTFNKEKGLKANQINWVHIRRLLPSWRVGDDIWAVGTDGNEHNCIHREIGKDPVFGLQKPCPMPDFVRERFHIGKYKMYYFEELVKTPVRVTTSEGWSLTMNPLTGAVMDIT